MNLKSHPDIKTIQNEEGTSTVSFDAAHCLRLYQEKNLESLCEEMYNVLLFFNHNNYASTDNSLTEFLNHFLQTFFYLICRPDFIIPTAYEEVFVELNNILCNITAISSYRTTCVALSVVLSQKNENLVKILMLLNPYNPVRFDIKLLFDFNPKLASIWYGRYLSHPGISSHLICYNNIKYALNSVNEKLQLDCFPVALVMLLSTYYDDKNDKFIKNKLNQLIFNALGDIKVPKITNKKKIAIASHSWYESTATYKCLSPLINSLKDDYELILINFSNADKNTDYSIFKQVISAKSDLNNWHSVLSEDMHVIIYPDISASAEGTLFSNMRIAPIQICMYGYPVSTFGAKIDYFIGGQEVEDITKAHENYSERLVLIPGLAVQSTWPNYKKHNLYKPLEDKIVICCPWVSTKYNYPLLSSLRKIIDRVNKHVVFCFIPSDLKVSKNEIIPFYKNLIDILGKDHIEVSSGGDYDYYMSLIETTDFAIDSYPVGGFNTVVDCLYLEKPFITYESSKVYSRYAATILRKLKVEDFIAHSDEEYISKIVELVNNPEKLSEAKSRFNLKDVKQVLDHLTDSRYFKKAIDHLIKNHEKYARQSTKDPIFIE